MMSWFFYILKCKDDSLYSGITNNLLNRLIIHNRGKGAKYTRSRRPVYLVYWEEYSDKSKASKREFEVKSWQREKKIRLIKTWRAPGSPRAESAGQAPR
ncbi:MAG: GIY-YIG nuclease family protein [Proteobacteria bacterium]|nr:GIY-YIG nuclease family protein [Pseudomonadota bacterium]